MLDKASERQMRRILGGSAMETLRADEGDDRYRRMYRPTGRITDESWGDILVQLRALGVIKAGVKKRTVSDKEVYWTLTPAGDAYLVRLKAKKRYD